MFIERVKTHLQMTSPDQLVPGALPSAPVRLRPAGEDPPSSLKEMYGRIGRAHYWSRPEEEWRTRLSSPAVGVWLVEIRGEDAGMVELERHASGEVEIAVFGLVPEFVGKGFGGHVLTLATTLAWSFDPEGEGETRRVWLTTTTLDHPNALPNYERRGFRPFRVVTERKEIPG